MKKDISKNQKRNSSKKNLLREGDENTVLGRDTMLMSMDTGGVDGNTSSVAKTKKLNAITAHRGSMSNQSRMSIPSPSFRKSLHSKNQLQNGRTGSTRHTNPVLVVENAEDIVDDANLQFPVSDLEEILDYEFQPP